MENTEEIMLEVSFRIPVWAIQLIAYDDCSGLTATQHTLVNEFIQDCCVKYGNGFIVFDDESTTWCNRNALDNKAGYCTLGKLVFPQSYKKQ